MGERSQFVTAIAHLRVFLTPASAPPLTTSPRGAFGGRVGTVRQRRNFAELSFNLFNRGPGATRVGFQRGAHGADMVIGRTATPANEFCA